MWMGVECPCPPVCNDIVAPRHLFFHLPSCHFLPNVSRVLYFPRVSLCLSPPSPSSTSSLLFLLPPFLPSLPPPSTSFWRVFRLKEFLRKSCRGGFPQDRAREPSTQIQLGSSLGQLGFVLVVVGKNRLANRRRQIRRCLQSHLAHSQRNARGQSYYVFNCLFTCFRAFLFPCPF